MELLLVDVILCGSKMMLDRNGFHKLAALSNSRRFFNCVGIAHGALALFKTFVKALLSHFTYVFHVRRVLNLPVVLGFPSSRLLSSRRFQLLFRSHAIPCRLGCAGHRACLVFFASLISSTS